MQVRRRCVFYVSGFDPRGAAHYESLYRAQAALQSRVNGLMLDIGRRRKDPSGNSYWPIHANGPDGDVEVHYEFMRWDDIVREHWTRNPARLWWDVVTTSWTYITTGALRKIFHITWPATVALFTPFFLICVCAAGVPLATALAAWIAMKVDVHPGMALLAGFATAVVLWWVVRELELRYSMGWLMRSYAFTMRQMNDLTPAMEARLDAHAARLAARIREACDDEVLVVGHSTGSNMAAQIVARAIRLQPLASRAPAVSLLTLGQCIPLTGTLPQAVRFREELALLATTADLTWIDFSAPPDGCCAALTDPIESCGVQPQGKLPDHPKLLSPKFADMFEAERYLPLKRDKFRMHFQYLMASEKAVAYDYFLITAGGRTLEERFRAMPGVVGYVGMRPFANRASK